MGEILKISTNDLSSIFNKIINHLETNGVKEIIFDSDFYWKLDSEEKFDVYNEPTLVIGQISDDLMELEKYFNNSNSIDILTIERLVAVLEAINFDNSDLFV